MWASQAGSLGLVSAESVKEYQQDYPLGGKLFIAAPDATEIGELLPGKIEYHEDGSHGAYLGFDKFSTSYRNSSGDIIVRDSIGEVYFLGDNEVESRAACWLYLKENKLI